MTSVLRCGDDGCPCRNLPAPDQGDTERLRAAVGRVRALHTSYVDSTETRCCAHEGDIWPCSTIAALDGEQGGT